MKSLHFIKLSFICLIAVFFSTSLKAQETKNVSINNFSEISVSVGIDLFITQGNSESAKIVANADVINEVVVEKDGNKVKVAWKQNWGMRTPRNRKAKVYINFIKLNAISASTGSSLLTENNLKTDHLDVAVSTGASIDAKILCEDLDLHSSTGATLTVKGTAKNMTVQSSTGSNINAVELITEYAKVQASTGANNRIDVTKALETTTSTGGSIDYKGNPSLKNHSKRSSSISRID